MPLVAVVLLAACVAVPKTTSTHASPPPSQGDASWRAVEPAGTAHYQLALGQVASGAGTIQRVDPVYPPSQLAACPPPVDVQALLIVDEAGKVGEVRVADEAAADPARRAFIAAARAAATQWRFAPLTVTRWAADANGNSHQVDSAARPFSQTYVFHFACHAGQSSTSASGAEAGG
ncbi:hypothetical protein [Frateuria defendens]|uniref:hypothetical protein n=1 Tax=Frateuria defendens TaxID=2219559 RepID=UPI00066FCEC5|nr:hypothetical protein [Frateuria defendens]